MVRPAVFLAVAAFLAAGVSTTRPSWAQGSEFTNAPAQTDTTIAPSGLDLYRQQYCGLCHALDKAGTAGIFGPTHNGMAAIAGERVRDPAYTGKARTARDYIRESITAPDVYLVPGFEATVHRMPPYAHLTPDVIDAIVQYLLEEVCAPEECTNAAAGD